MIQGWPSQFCAFNQWGEPIVPQSCVPMTPVCMPGVVSFNGRTGAVTLNLNDILAAGGGGGIDLDSPNFTGIPTAPTAPPGTCTAQIATTLFVCQAITNALLTGVAGVVSFDGRNGVVSLLLSDITGAGGAPIASPHFSGVPTAATAAPGTSTTQVATTAFVTAAVASGVAGVTSFNTRTGAVTLTLPDITGAGGAPIASPVFTGIPAAATAPPGTSTTQLATTAFVQAAITSGVAGVTSFNGRTGAVTLTLPDVTGVGGAPIASPVFSGIPAGPTAAPGTSTTQLATTAFVAAAIAALSPGTAGVTSFNGRAGAVTLTLGDITGAGGAPLASPIFTGVPQAPTAASAVSNNQLATTAFVHNVLSGGVTAINGIPAGGTARQVLEKNSSTNYDVAWVTIGAYAQYESDINFSAYPLVTQVNVTVATIQPGDYDLTVTLGPQGGNLGNVDFFLSPLPAGMQNQMRGTLFLSTSTGGSVGINDSVVVGQPSRGSFTVATAMTFSVKLDNSAISSSGASFAKLVLTSRRVG